MIRYTSERQLPLNGFLLQFAGTLNSFNQWIKLSSAIPWDNLVKGCHNKMNAEHKNTQFQNKFSKNKNNRWIKLHHRLNKQQGEPFAK